jgi:hypothetical protein
MNRIEREGDILSFSFTSILSEGRLSGNNEIKEKENE